MDEEEAKEVLRMRILTLANSALVEALTRAKTEIAKCDTASRVRVVNDFEAGIRYAVEYAEQVIDDIIDGKPARKRRELCLKDYKPRNKK